MTYIIHIHADPRHQKYEHPLTRTAESALSYLRIPSGELSVVLTDAEQIREFNRKYRDIDQPTDVLSFKGEIEDPDSGLTYLGDVIIAVPIAESQAINAGHSIEEELNLLTVHGLLHLLGYQHSNDVDRERMWEIQSNILQKVDGSAMEASNHDPKARSRIDSFRHAFTGLWYVLRTQRNAWIHALATMGVVLLGLWLEIELRDWATITLAILLVWISEIINTALEAITDLASPRVHPLARVGKDVGAGAVLLASIAAIILGLLVLLPALLDKLN